MAGTSPLFALDILDMVLQAIVGGGAATNMFRNSATPYTNLYISLLTADPGSSNSQLTSEAAYTSYARQPVPRAFGNWTLHTNYVTPVNNITFPTATGGAETETYAGIGTDISGAGNLLWSGAITPSIIVGVGVAPQLTPLSQIAVA
jgi:hypothetical protein